MRSRTALGMQTRVPTGEKGIGRLAIAAIGPQVLLVTRARRPDGLHPTVASFVKLVAVSHFRESRLTNSKSLFVSFQTANCLRRRTFPHSLILFERT